jgi:signal transduction histidine kinase/CHASE2 domain-containing sensor protein
MPYLSSLSRWQRLGLSLQLGALLALLLLALWGLGWFERVQLRLTNLLYIPQEASGPVVIVAIDDASLNKFGRTPSQWSRDLHGQLVNIAAQGGARVVAFDVLFPEATQDDTAFAANIRAARASEAGTRTVLPVVGVSAQPTSNAGTLQFTEILTPSLPLSSAAEYLASVNYAPDPDNTLRRIPMRISDSQANYYALSLASYLAYLRLSPTLAQQVLSFESRALVLPSGEQLPLDAHERLWINFFSRADGRSFPIYSYQEVLSEEFDPSVFEDKIILVGLINSQGITDLHTVPLSYNGLAMAGVEAHANALETLLQRRALQEQPALVQALTIFLLTLAASALYGQLSRRWFGAWIFGAAVLAIIAWTVVATLIFITRLEVPNLLFGMLALALPAPAILAQYAVLEARQRQRAELLLTSMVHAASQPLSLEKALPTIARDFAIITQGQQVAIWLWDEIEDSLKCHYPAEGPLFAPQAEAVQKQQIVHYEQNVLAMPLIWQGRPLGVLAADSVPALDHSRREMLNLFTWQSSAVIHNIQQVDQIQRMSETKTFIIRMASHDLKNPLMGVTSFSEFLLQQAKDRPAPDPSEIEMLESIITAGNEMRGIINHILDLERIRSGKRRVERFDLTLLLGEVLEEFRLRAKQKGQTLDDDLTDQTLTMLGDPEQLKLAFINLVGNAIKYTPQNGHIRVMAQVLEQSVRVTIQDNGYGIPAEAIPQLFKEFFRVRTADTRHIDGTGLGLNLVKLIIEGHQGRVWVESEVKVGSRFFVELPLIQATAPLAD